MGAIDLVMFNPPNIEAQDKSAGVIQIPYQFDGYEHAHRVLGETARPWLDAFLQRNGLAWIANFEYGFRALSNSRRPVMTPDDVKGLKLRVPPELSIQATFEALGANTQTIAFGELYLALSSGTVDGQDNPISVDYANKFYEVQSHIATTRHVYTSFMLTGNPAQPRRAVGRTPGDPVGRGAEGGQGGAGRGAGGRRGHARQDGGRGRAGHPARPRPFRDMMGPAWERLRERIGGETWDEWMGYVEAARTS